MADVRALRFHLRCDLQNLAVGVGLFSDYVDGMLV